MEVADGTHLRAAVAAAAGRFARGDLHAVVVASPTGATAVLLARALGEHAGRLICVADTPEWAGQPYPMLEPRHHEELLTRGARVLRDYRSTSVGAPRFDPDAGRDVPMTPAEAFLFWEGVAAAAGEGAKVAAKSVVLAADNGLLPAGAPVVALGGGPGQERVIVMDAVEHAGLLAGVSRTRLRIREIVF